MLHYQRTGRGPALVMQHGFMGGSGYWRAQMDAFASRFDVIAPDLAGFAGSAGEPVRTSIEGHAAALVELLDGLGVERFHLLGHSMGGMVALQLALDHPQRVSSLILYGAASRGALPERFETFEASIRRLEDEGVEACARRIASTWLIDGESSGKLALCLEAGRGTRQEAAVAALSCFRRWDVSHRLDELRMPTLIVSGDRDRSVDPKHALALWRAIRGSALCIAPGSAHAVHLDDAVLFENAVGRFLQRAEPPTRASPDASP
jgi:pimeloyl-ACP methyl ester carboxylesterase